MLTPEKRNAIAEYIAATTCVILATDAQKAEAKAKLDAAINLKRLLNVTCQDEADYARVLLSE